MLVTALTVLVIAAPAAPATPNVDRGSALTSSLAGTTSSTDLRSPDARDAASVAHLKQLGSPRGDSVNPGHEPASSTHTKIRADGAAALAQERYYSSYTGPRPINSPATVSVADTGDGIAPLPFILSVSGALLVGLATGLGLHQLRARRRHAAGLAV